MNVEVYTDGSATTKDKPGGFGWVLVVDGIKHSEGSGWMANATNNDAELRAAIMGLGNALKMLSTIPAHPIPEKPEVTLVSDSQIVLGWTNGTYRFKQSAKAEEYVKLMHLVKALKVKTRWVEGHAGHEHNERCDKLARDERRKAMGIVPKKSTSKSTLMLKALREIAKIASDELACVSIRDIPLERIQELCRPFLGNK